jgi:FkbM family methyltransferase
MNILKALPASAKHRVRKSLHKLLSALPLGRQFSIRHLGYTVFVDTQDHCGREIFIKYLLFRRWEHERFEQAIVEALIRQLGVCWVVDVGASYGMYSLLAARLLEKQLVSKIVAIEASPNTVGWLRKTIEFNRLGGAVQLLELAASVQDGKDLVFITHSDHSEWSRLAQIGENVPTQKTIIKSITLNTVLEDFAWLPSIPLFIKMDIEGGEPNAVAGLRESLCKAENYFLVVEFHVGLLDRTDNGAMIFAKQLWDLGAKFVYELNEGKERLVPIPNEEAFEGLVQRCRAGTLLSEIMTNIVLGTQEIRAKIPLTG